MTEHVVAADAVGREAQARARAYELLAELVARGVRPETRELALASPAIAAALSQYPEGDLDEAAADHQHAFGFCVQPYEGIFVDPDAQVGGSATPALTHAYELIGFVPDPTGDDPEHLATQLRALAFACRLEDGAERLGRREEVQRVQQLTRALLDDHLLRWLPVFGAAVRRLERPLPTAIVDQLGSLVTLHRVGLGGRFQPFALPPMALDLDDPKTGLRDIAEALSQPARSGLFLSREDLARIGRDVEVPRGFGDRRTLLANLLRAAAHLDALPAVTERLVALARETCAALGQPEGLREAGFDATLSPWRRRAAETETLLERLHGEAAAHMYPDAPTADDDRP